MLVKLFFSFIAGSGTGVLYNTEQRLIVYCGVSGMLTWFVYDIFTLMNFSEALASFIALMALTFFTRFLSKLTRVPTMMFNIAGIMPIVPGGLLFKTFNNLAEKHYEAAVSYGFQAVLVGGAIAIGFMLNEVIARGFHLAKDTIQNSNLDI